MYAYITILKKSDNILIITVHVNICPKQHRIQYVVHYIESFIIVMLLSIVFACGQMVTLRMFAVCW